MDIIGRYPLGRYVASVLRELGYKSSVRVFEDPNLPGTMETSVSLRAVSCGTEVRIEQSNLPEMIPLESCCLGWQESLILLAKLVEAEITEG